MSVRTITCQADVPKGEPRRYLNARGYVRLRWRVGTEEYAEVYEHRLRAGFPPRHMHVHHINGDKTDNRPENLQVLSASEHQRVHLADPEWMERSRVRPHPRQPLETYPRCSESGCGRPAQCVNRSICLKHYKALRRRERGVVPRASSR